MNARSTAICIAVLLSAPLAAAAQTQDRIVAGAGLGVARTWDDESLLGTGLLTEGRIGWLLTPKTQITFDVTHLPYERRFESGVATEGRSVFLGGALKYDFTRGDVRPFVLAGYGINQFRGSRTDPFLGTRETASRDHGYVLGTGFVMSRGNWEVGPEARVYMLAIENDSSAAMMLTGSIRASMRF